MKSHGTRTVKDTCTEDSQDEPYHMLSDWLEEPEFKGQLDALLQEVVSDLCEETSFEYELNGYADWKALEEDVIRNFGRHLHHYRNRATLKAIVINLLVCRNQTID